MTCETVRARLNDYVDGEVPRDDVALIEAHLKACADCRLQLDRLRALLADAAALPRSIDPQTDLWPRIAGGMRRSQYQRRVPWSWAAAAVLLIGLSSGMTALWMQRHQKPVADFATARAEYERASAQLVLGLDTGADRPAPATIAAVQRSLRVIDAAIAEAEAALARDPGHHELEQLLWARYQQRIELLQRAARAAEKS